MKLILFVAAIFSSACFASVLTFHIECDPSAEGCMEVSIPKTGEKVRVQDIAAITLGESDFDDVAMVLGTNDSQQFRLWLRGEPSTKLAEVTGANIGKRLVVMEGDHALLAPRIMDVIKTKVFDIAPGNGGWDAIPWLKVIAEKNMPTRTEIYLETAALLALLALVIGTSIYFYRRRRKVKA